MPGSLYTEGGPRHLKMPFLCFFVFFAAKHVFDEACHPHHYWPQKTLKARKESGLLGSLKYLRGL